jgi:hypothetical protein
MKLRHHTIDDGTCDDIRTLADTIRGRHHIAYSTYQQRNSPLDVSCLLLAIAALPRNSRSDVYPDLGIQLSSMKHGQPTAWLLSTGSIPRVS